MKRQEIVSSLKQGTLYVRYNGRKCLVLHCFKHTTWINYEGRIKSVRHKYLELSEWIRGESTHSITPRLTLGKEKEILDRLLEKYKAKINEKETV